MGPAGHMPLSSILLFSPKLEIFKKAKLEMKYKVLA
jgi:hypothetical protein